MTTNKLWMSSILWGAAVFSVPTAALAAPTVSYNSNGNGVLCGTTNDNNQSGLVTLMQLCGATVERYKANVAGQDEGGAAAWYTTAFTDSPNDPSGATISWIGTGSFIDCVTLNCWLGVKDGNQEPAAYAYSIFGWDGLSDIVLSGFWPNQGAISNVSIWSGPRGGGDDDDIPVSSPGTLVLAGLGLTAIGLVRRRARTGA